MGAINQSSAIYLTISNGKISRRVMQPTDTSIERVNKEGKVVHEEFYKGWQGHIVNIEVREHKDYGKFWNVTLRDQSGDAILQMNYSGGYASAFLKQLPNVDFTSHVTIIPSMKIEGDKKKASLFIQQHGQALKHFYTRDTPNGLPQLKKIKVKGKETYDDSDMMEFLEKMVKDIIIPKIKQAGTKMPVEVGQDDNADDLPF